MKCSNCGFDIAEGEKFCGNCGTPVTSATDAVVEQSVETQIAAPAVENAAETVIEDTVKEVPTQEQPITIPEVAAPSNETAPQPKGKKNYSGIIAIIAIVLILALVFCGLKFFGIGKESYEKSVSTMEKAVANLTEGTNESGTVKATIDANMKMGKSNMSFAFTAFMKYSVKDNNYKFNFGTEKTEILGTAIDAINMYAEGDKELVTVYVPNSLFSLMETMMGESDSSLPKDTYQKYELSFKDLGISIPDNFETANSDMDLKQLLVKDSFKYVGKSNGLKHYVLTIDEKYVRNLGKNLKVDPTEVNDTVKEMNGIKFNIDFYINDKDEIEKVAIDFKEVLKEELEGTEVDKLLLTIEFKDMNNTTVEIPASVKANAQSMTTEDAISSLSF